MCHAVRHPTQIFKFPIMSTFHPKIKRHQRNLQGINYHAIQVGPRIYGAIRCLLTVERILSNPIKTASNHTRNNCCRSHINSSRLAVLIPSRCDKNKIANRTPGNLQTFKNNTRWRNNSMQQIDFKTKRMERLLLWSIALLN